jgi:hypothetical protein
MRSYCLCQKEDVSRKWNGPCGREVAEFDDGACNATVAGPDTSASKATKGIAEDRPCISIKERRR